MGKMLLTSGRMPFCGQAVIKSKVGSCRIAWPTVCRPRELGGLGLVDLRRFGIALRLRWLWLRRAGSARAWESLPAAEEKAIRAVFSVATESILGDGKSTLFWTDRWIQGESIRSIAPALFAAVPKSRLSRTVADAVIGNRRQ